MSKIDNLRREIKYNAYVFRILADRDIPYLVWHGPDGKTIEAKTGIVGLALLIKTTPMPEGKVLLIVKPTGMNPFVDEFDEKLLIQRFHAYLRKILS
ncbi:hypothetical protein SEA_FEDE_20 [Microbacterium phage Fede]|nr:hypothetical protein SEA_FEDE_20 [Microbacterium phage Fede]